MFKRKSAAPKRTLWQEVKSLLGIAVVVLVLRTFVFQPFTIPSGSMEPGLIEGDYIIVSKLSTGYGRHAAWPFPFPVKKDRLMKRGADRGDVLVFRPDGLNKDYIKRVIGLPGDEVEVRDHRLFINGEQVDQIGEYPFITETVDGRSYATQHMAAEQGGQAAAPDGKFLVPEGFYFMLGDNRDNSLDSRVMVDTTPGAISGAGLVPSVAIVGEAKFVLLSVKDDFVIYKPWTWYKLRGNRWFKGIR